MGKLYPRAQLAYEKVLKLDPDNALAHYNLAILFDEFLKRPADALPHYREYQRLSGKQDLKVMAWVAEIEASMPKPAPAPVAAPATVYTLYYTLSTYSTLSILIIQFMLYTFYSF